MGDALFELEHVLRSSKYKLTPAEDQIIQMCKAKAIKNFTVTALAASGLVWAATRRLGYGYRINLCGAAGIFSGMWLFDRSLTSCLDNILSLEGSRMQSELAKILLTKHRDNPWTKKIIMKHFYPEKVFDDSSSDMPISRWRFRNYYGDSAAQSQTTNDSDTYESNETNTDKEPKQFSNRTDTRQSPLQMSSSVEVTADPFDCVFGNPEKGKEIHHPVTPEISPKRRSRSHKRALRRHRARRTDVSSDTSSNQSRAELE